MFSLAGIAISGFSSFQPADCPECTTCMVPEPNLEPNPCQDAPLVAMLPNIPCNSSLAQSPADVTRGTAGAGNVDPLLDPAKDFNEEGMCTVNVHWHLGAEHLSKGEYDPTYMFEHPFLPKKDHRSLAEGGIPRDHVGHMCRIAKEGFDKKDPLFTTEYDWKYCKGMHVGLTYEIHWPHSNLGHCQSKWQYQSHFMDGVLCDATTGGVDLATAAKLIFEDGTVKFGVEGQVFTVVNSLGVNGDPNHSPFSHQTWDSMNGWNKAIVKDDYAIYKGSTTGPGADNEICRGTGGMVTWHQDRDCHAIEASTFDNLCRMMLVIPADDLSPDVEPHGARDTVHPDYFDDPDDDQRA